MKINLSFKYKIMLSFLAIELFFLSFIIIYNYNSVKRFSSDMIDSQIKSNITLFKELITTPLMIYDLATLDNMTEHFGKLPNIGYVLLKDNKQRILSEYKNKEYKHLTDRQNRDLNHIISNFVIKNDSSVLGYGKVIFDVERIVEDINIQTQNIIKIAILEILLSIVAAFYLGRALTKNLTILDRAFKNTSNVQDKITTVNINSGDEFEHLASSFNRMQINIKNEVEKNKRNQVHLAEQSKMAAMGEMIGNIAHQWRQPLSVISSGVTGLQILSTTGPVNNKDLNDCCDMVNKNAQYLSTTIEDFKNFIKGTQVKNKFLLKNTISSLLRLVEGTTKNYKLNIILDLKEDIKIDGYENELIQCLINIFNNAKDVLQYKEENNRLILITSLIEKNNAVLILKDNAGGIPVDILPRIFEPYFTTKHKSKGTGLGLNMTYNLIVDGMNGDIEVQNVEYDYDNKIYTGAQFTIILPLV